MKKLSIEQSTGLNPSLRNTNCTLNMLSAKTLAAFQGCARNSPQHASRWTNVWVLLAYDLFVEPQTRSWYSIQPWARDKHNMDALRTSSLTILRHNIDLRDSTGGSSSPSEPAPASDVQSVVLIDFLDISSWGDTTALARFEECVIAQTSHVLAMPAGDYGYGLDAVYFIMAVGTHWRFGLRNATGFRYESTWYNALNDSNAQAGLARLVEMVEGL